jgi:hypothetical protein
MFNKTYIIFWQQGSPIECRGHIEAITDNSVTINGGRYLKELCQFRASKPIRIFMFLKAFDFAAELYVSFPSSPYASFALSGFFRIRRIFSLFREHTDKPNA